MWILDTGSSNHLVSPDSLSGRLKNAVRENAHAVRLATANGIIEAADTVDVFIPDLNANARILVLPDTPSVLSVGRLVEQHGCAFHWTPEGARIIDPDGGVHPCDVRNHVPHLDAGSLPARDACVPAPALPAGAVEEPHENMEPDEFMAIDADDPSWHTHELHHLPKRADCPICVEAKAKMQPARRRDPALKEKPEGWGHTLHADHLCASDFGLTAGDLKLGLTLLDIGTSYGDMIVVRSKATNDTVMALREFYGDQPAFFFHSDNAPELKAASDQELMVHVASTPHRPESNGVIERFNQLLIDGARCLLLQSGLPARYWHYACRAFLLARNSALKSKDGKTPWERRHEQQFPGKQIPFGSKVIYRLPRHEGGKFDPRGSEGVFLGCHLHPGGRFVGDYLVLSLDHLLSDDAPRATVHRVKGVSRPPGPTTYPLREARIAMRKDKAADLFNDDMFDDLEEEEDIEENEMDDIEQDSQPPALEDGADAGGPNPADGGLMRVPRASRIYIPRVGPPPPPTKAKPPPSFQDTMRIKFIQKNPKRVGSRSHELYEAYKTAKTVGEALEKGASKGHLRYDISRGHAKLEGDIAIVCFGPSRTPCSASSEDPDFAVAAPLLEGWCAKDSELGKVGNEMGRNVFRYTEEDDLSKASTIRDAFKTIRDHPGCHLHGSLPCTPWSQWQRLNFTKADPEGREKIMRAREQSLEWVATFHRMARSVVARGGSASFEWPRWCAGWDQPLVQQMVNELKMILIDVDGCAVGLTNADGQPILKPWRIAVTSELLANSLGGLRCDKTHEHASCAGRETARTAFYPVDLCRAIHRGLDHHEAAHAAAACEEPGYETKADDDPASGPGGRSYSDPLAALSGTELETGVGRRASVPGSGPASPPPAESPPPQVLPPGGRHEERASERHAACSTPAAPGGQSHPVTVHPPGGGISRGGGSCRSVPCDFEWDYADDPGQVLQAQLHRERARVPPCGALHAMVTRVIANGSPESKSPGCLASLGAEKDKMNRRGVWEEEAVNEWHVVKSEDSTASVGRVFSILGEKHAELKRPEPEKEYKARIVFAGNAIQTASGVAPHELFQEMSSAPAAMASIRATLAIGALKGYRPLVRDAAQAYIQARIDGPGRPATWVRLPKHMWPEHWHGKFKDPVVPLRKALYGHPESGALWEKHLAGILTKLGWAKIDSHPGVWYNQKDDAVLAVYVDDLLMVAPPALEAKLWGEIGNQVQFDEEPAPIGKFLGAYHDVSSKGKVTTLDVQMNEFLADAAEIYAKEVGIKKLAPVRTPYLPEDFAPKGAEQPGEQAGTASSHLMKLLFAARLCRPDLLVAITRLASKVSAWNQSHDRALKRLMQYVSTKPHLQLRGQLSTDDLNDVVLVISPDADLAGDLETAKSTTGMFLELQSKDGTRFWPLAWRSKRQGSTATSTCEAEYIAMSTTSRTEAIPMQIFLEQVLRRRVSLVCLEDNTQCLGAVKSGYSAALRSLPRTERISLSVAHETYVLTKGNEIRHFPTDQHKGDVFTKRLDPAKFEEALDRLGLHE